MRNKFQYALEFFLLINIGFAVYLINDWYSVQPTTRTIPINLIKENSLITSEIRKLAENTGNKRTILALMSSKASNCAENNIATFFKRLDMQDIQPYILFSSAISDQDISTFRANFQLSFEVRRMNSELAAFWEQMSQEYETPGVVILSSQNGLFASSDLAEIKKAIEAN